MKKNYFICLVLFYSFFLVSQNLPEEYYFSEDGTRFIRGGQDSQGFYDELEIKTIYLYFDQPDFWEQLQNNYCDKINISATLVYEGETFENVGVRFKGQTSYFNTNGENGGGPGGGGPGGGGPGGSVETDKKSFNIELDWIEDQDIDGYQTLNLNNGYQDPSFLREFIFEKLSRNYIPSLKVNFVKLIINDQDWGIYPNVQQLDKRHSGEWFFDDECTRWRAEDPNSDAPGCGEPNGGPGGGPGGGGPNFGAGTSSLNYLGDDTLNYLDHYTLKKSYIDNPWDNLVNACNAVYNVENFEDPYVSLNEFLDLDATLWHLAVEIIFSDDDSYINKGGMDYYVYYDVYNERILPIEYDGNTVFGNPNWSPFYNENDTDFALLNKLLAIPELRQRYLAHFRTILFECFNTDYINALIDYYANFIDQSVEDDPQKIYTYNEFLNEVEALKDYFYQRNSFLLSNNEINQDVVEIENVYTSVSQPNSTEEVQVEVLVTSGQPVWEVNLYYGTGLTGSFEKTTMYSPEGYDDSFWAIIPPQNGGQYVRYYVETIHFNGSRNYSPKGAEHDVYVYQVKMDEIVMGDLVINEIMASNDNVATDEYGEYDDWIEIYNKGDVPMNLSGYYLSDDINNLTKYTFPDFILESDQYFIVWADDDEEDQGDYNHATFKLSASGEELYFSDPDLNIIDNCLFGEQQTDLGYARVPNGTGNFIIQNPTFNFNNEQNSSLIDFPKKEKELVKIIDLLGRESKKNQNGILIEIYDDNSIEKKLKIQ